MYHRSVEGPGGTNVVLCLGHKDVPSVSRGTGGH